MGSELVRSDQSGAHLVVVNRGLDLTVCAKKGITSLAKRKLREGTPVVIFKSVNSKSEECDPDCYIIILAIRSERFASMELSNNDPDAIIKRLCSLLKWVLHANSPRDVPIDASSMFIKKVREVYEICPYNVVTMFIKTLNIPYVLPPDLALLVARKFIRNLFNPTRAILQTYTVASAFIEMFFENRVTSYLRISATSMFMKEILGSTMPVNLIYLISEMYFRCLMKATSVRILYSFEVDDIIRLLAIS